MAPRHTSKQHILDIMKQVGFQDRIPEAQRILPDEVDLDRDGPTLARLGLSLDRIVDELGGGPW
ncbi:MAG: hypothetical protein JWN95_1648 [Frankiales bacterium]|nr:hypothetical protein [Frankiales bacterium]